MRMSLFLAIGIVFSAIASASTSDISAILSNSDLLAIESKLSGKGYRLVSVNQTSYPNPHVADVAYSVTFKRGDKASGWPDQFDTTEISVSVSHYDGKITVTVPKLIE